jgi:trehalose/maltose hydrolase-like predicted phosphorylase
MAVSGLILFASLPGFCAGFGTDASTDSVTTNADSFQFSTHSFSNSSSTLLGNGYLFGATPWNGTSASEATLAGLYDQLEENAYPYQALIPSWNGIDFWNGTHWVNALSAQAIDAQGYLQVLDAYRGVLSTSYDWVDSNHLTRVETQEFVSRPNSRLAVVRISITPQYGVEVGPVTVSFPLGGETGPPFVWEGAELPGSIPIRQIQADNDRRGFVAISQTRDGRTQVAEAVRIALPPNVPPLLQVHLGFDGNLDTPALRVKFIARQGETYTFTKFVAVESSLDSNAPVDDARTVAAEAERAGFDSILREHVAGWRSLWETDVIIRGDAQAQRIVHAAMFYLFSALRPGVEWSVPAMSLPSRAYLGRIWWDADTWIFPSILVLHPELARSIVAYRCHRLPAAEENAQIRGLRGALYPMESAATGQEAAPEWSSEIHISGDVAMAQWRYYQATGDLQWLRECGYPNLRAASDFWASRATFDAQHNGYEILHVTGPNEAITNVNNDAYTNAIARRTLQVATEAARLLGETPSPEWTRVNQKLVIPFDTAHDVHLEHTGDEAGQFAHALILLAYPLDLGFPDVVKRHDLQVCLKNFGRPGYDVGMLGNFYSIVASELVDRNLAYKLFLSTIRSYAQPPFYAMTETPSNGRAVFLTAEGAFLQQVIFGFTGLRLTDEGLKGRYPPSLPLTWQSLEMRGISSRGKRYDIQVTSDGKLTMTSVSR